MNGTSVGHYRILEKVGEGGMGVVYKAEDIRLGRFVALKFLPDEFAGDPEVLERFRREARTVSALNHPNICTLYDIGEENGRTFLAMELLEGENLRELILRNGALPLTRILTIASGVAEALVVAHDRGIIHRDIKSANIFVTREGRVKVLDFGLAKVVGAHRLSGSSGRHEPLDVATNHSGGWALGTIAYMSPEQALGKPLDARTDIFSFGVVLYEMATGVVPFRGDTTGTLFLSVVQEAPVSPELLNPQVPNALQRIIKKCLEKDREIRYQHMSELLDQLNEFRSNQSLLNDSRKTLASEVSPDDQAEIDAGTIPRSRIAKWILPVAVVVTLAVIAITLIVAGVTHSTKKGSLSEKEVIVVSELVNTTGDPIFDGALKEALSIGLEQSSFLNLLPDRQVNSTLRLMNRSGAGPLNAQDAREVCLRTNSRVYVTGTISRIGDTYSIGLKALNCQTDETVASVHAAAGNRDLVIGSLDEATVELRRKLGESLPLLHKFNRRLSEVTTSSLEALQAYSQGIEKRQLMGSMEAIPSMRRAVEIDPSFARAHAQLGTLYLNTSQWELARQSYLRAYELRDRVSDRERFYIESQYFYYIVGETEKANEVYKQWSSDYPGDSIPHSRLGVNYLESGEFETAIGEFEQALRLGTDTPYSNAMAALISLSRFDKAKFMFVDARSRGLDSDFLRLNRYTLAFLENDEQTMREQVDWAKGRPGYEDTLLFAQSGVEAYFGRLSNARQLEVKARLAASKANTQVRSAEFDADSSLREAQLGNVAFSRKDAATALASSTAPDIKAKVALAFAMSGDVTQAETLVDQLALQFPHSTMVQYSAAPAIRAMIHVRKKRPAEAVKILESVTNDYVRYGIGSLQSAYVRGLAFLDQRKGAEAAAEFQKLIDHPGAVGTSVIGSLARLQMARAEAMIGNKSAARTHYEEFFALWKDADPDLLVLKQAKLEFARL